MQFWERSHVAGSRVVFINHLLTVNFNFQLNIIFVQTYSQTFKKESQKNFSPLNVYDTFNNNIVFQSCPGRRHYTRGYRAKNVCRHDIWCDNNENISRKRVVNF